MRKATRLRIIAALAVAAIAAFAIASVAGATSGSDSFNPTLRVTVSMVSSGANPELAQVRDTVTETMTVTNLGAKQYARIFQSSNMPSGTSPNKDQLKLLNTGQTWSWTAKTKIHKGTTSGVYTIGVAALGSGVLDPSAASATMTINTDPAAIDDTIDLNTATETLLGQ